MMRVHNLICGIVVFVTFILMISELTFVTSFSTYNKMHELRDKRSFHDAKCKGVYDKVIFSKIDQICEDCYNLFREQKLHSLCSKDCFSTEYFKGCVETLNITDEAAELQSQINRLRGLD